MSVVGNFLIEEALYNLFTVTDEHFQKVEVGQFPESLVPGMNVAVLSGRFSRSDLDSYRQSLDIIILIAVQNIHSEYECRRLVHPLVEYVVRKLAGSDLGLDIEPIEPLGWSEKTTKQGFELGEVVFEVRLTTASTIPSGPISDETEQDMTEILAEYALLQKPPQMQASNPTQEQLVPPITSTQVIATEGTP